MDQVQLQVQLRDESDHPLSLEARFGARFVEAGMGPHSKEL